MKKALISGITGQDGSYLAEFLLGKGYEVYGIIRRSSSFNTGRIDPIYEDPHVPHRRLHLVYGDLNDASSLNHIIRTVQPDEIYNLGAKSRACSFDNPEYTADDGCRDDLGSLRRFGSQGRGASVISRARARQMVRPPATETTPFYPRSPYGCAKVYAYWAAVNYRESYGMFVATACYLIMNHPGAERLSSLARFARGGNKSGACSRTSFWEILTRDAIGVSREISSRPCG